MTFLTSYVPAAAIGPVRDLTRPPGEMERRCDRGAPRLNFEGENADASLRELDAFAVFTWTA